jgi:hypothetical protein
VAKFQANKKLHLSSAYHATLGKFGGTEQLRNIVNQTQTLLYAA